MIGTNLALILPDLTDPLATTVAKIRTALDAIQVSIADKATQAALNLTDSFDLGGNAIVNAVQLKLSSGTVPTTAGSLYYHGGEWYMRDATGAVRITNGGALDITATAGFTGDYGTGNEQAYYDTASAQYRLYSDFGAVTWADVAARRYYLESNGHAVGLKAPAGLAASYDITMPTALPGSTLKLWLTAAGVLTTTPPTTTVTFNVSNAAASVTDAATWTRSGGALVTVAAGQATAFFPLTLPVGAVITGYKIYCKKTSNATFDMTSNLIVSDTANLTVSTTPGTGTEKNSANAPSFINLSKTGLSITVATNQSQWLQIYNSASHAGDEVYYATVDFTTPTP